MTMDDKIQMEFLTTRKAEANIYPEVAIGHEIKWSYLCISVY